MDKIRQHKLILSFSNIVFLLTSILLVSILVITIRDEKYEDVPRNRFTEDILYVFGIIISIVHLIGLNGIIRKNICLVTFYTITGSGMFIYLLLISFYERIIVLTPACIFAVLNIFFSLATLKYVYLEENVDYKLINGKSTVKSTESQKILNPILKK